MSNPNLFNTAHLIPELRKRSVRGGAITICAQAAKFVLTLVMTAWVARILTPADFGLVTMVTAVTGFVLLFKDLGLSAATVQARETSHEDVCSLFWINVAFSIFLACSGIALAPLCAWFYGEPKVLPVMVALSVTFVFAGLGAQHLALLRRGMRFVAIAVVEVVSVGVGAGTTIAVSAAHQTHWALVAGIFATTLLNTVLLWSVSPWRPTFPRWRPSLTPALTFGLNVTLFNVINYVSRNLDNIIIARVCGASALGIYAKAYGLMLLPLSQIMDPLASVAMPLFSRLQDDPARLRSAFLRFVSLLAMATLPPIAVALCLSDEIIFVFLGGQWAGAVPIFQTLGLCALAQPLLRACGLLLLSTGQHSKMLRIAFAFATATTVSFVVGVWFGPIGVARAYALCVWLCMPFIVTYSVAAVGITSIDLLRAYANAATLATVMSAGILIVKRFGPVSNDLVTFLTGLVLSLCLWLVGMAVLFRHLDPRVWLRTLTSSNSLDAVK